MSSYQFHLSGEKDFGATQPADPAFPDSIIAKCPFHHNYALADGSVQSINPAVFQEVQIGGRWYLKRINDSPASQP
jgi:hypothetical protein